MKRDGFEAQRSKQAKRVMPLIGGFLDAWDQLPNDIKSDEYLSSVREYVEQISSSMEGQHE